ncbi:disks large-associated protein 4 [Lucilia cuprina]|uniref:disks large-associated protein 4 n=1 Tax=Lucilia cuprina TaxID=7375 RepID=UPI001F06F054|nr:disks large-associated protein 4 [Lucilia cuprina]XP_046811646.1 disks large-associated protein 4 [Lucilia cuprina]XP_046811647.1 disks large-associated protein 4 [Lucilia cuprina]
MDRSMDSIGSCSLDVDAESSDISDTSGSLNFPTPISIKDITREFTNNIRERCSVQTVKNTTAYVDPVTGQVCIALTTPPTATTTVNNNISGSTTKTTPTAATTTALLSPQTPEDSYDKKPSYLNLACCVNGYSNITTYDSKIRQDINKSREVSPIRPSSSSLQYCKKSNSLAPPVLLAMPNVNLTSPQQQQPSHHHMMAGTTNGVYVTSASLGSKYSIIENNNHSQNGLDAHNTSDDSGGGGAKRSFIQQRVERLYGPGALAQGFYSPKKIKDSSSRLNKSDITENGGGATSELARKFQELSPSKDYNQFRKKLSNGRPPIPPANMAAKDEPVKLDNNNIDLPCLRHLSQEFRAQLPVVSPKRNFTRTSPGRDTIQPQTHTTAITTNGINNTTTNNTTSNTPPHPTVTPTSGKLFEEKLQQQQQNSLQQIKSSAISTSSPITGQDELDHKVAVAMKDIDISALEKLVPAIDEPKVVLPLIDPHKSQNLSTTDADPIQSPSTTNGSGNVAVKDAHFFLKQLKDEQNRLLIMAAEVEKYLDALASNPDITEDTLGLLRSASGKARLLVSQKMKQFEGLCHNNLNSSPEDQFPTTVDDLQGFWDMVYLQVDHVDSIFADIENLKKNDWKKPLEVKPPVSVLKTPRASKTPMSSKTKPSTPMTNGGGATATPSAAALKREAQRKKLQEMKRRNREAMAAASTNSSSTQEATPIEIVGMVKNNNETTASNANDILQNS